MKLSKVQMVEIIKGLNSGVDITKYSNNGFSAKQMCEIRKGLEKGLDVEKYRNPDFDFVKMRVIRKAMKKGINLDKYIENYNFSQLSQIVLGMKDGLDVSKFDSVDNSSDVMRTLRLSMSRGFDLKFFNNVKDHAVARLIYEGLIYGLDVTKYNSPDISYTEAFDIYKKLASDRSKMSKKEELNNLLNKYNIPEETVSKFSDLPNKKPNVLVRYIKDCIKLRLDLDKFYDLLKDGEEIGKAMKKLMQMKIESYKIEDERADGINWVIHCVTHKIKNEAGDIIALDNHTHGLEKSIGYELQWITGRLEPNVIASLINKLGLYLKAHPEVIESVKDAEGILSFHKVKKGVLPDILVDVQLKILPTFDTNESVSIRVIVPDANGCYPWNNTCQEDFKYQISLPL